MTPSKAMVDKLLRGCTSAGQAEMAKLAYQMARSCMSYAEGTTGHFRLFEDTRDIPALRRMLTRLEARTGVELDTAGLPLTTPTHAMAISAGRACLTLGEQIEGSSPRIQYLLALFLRAEGALDEAEERLQRMLVSPLPKRWAGFVLEGRQTTLLTLRRYDEIVGITDERPEALSATAAFNLATAHAWLGDHARFMAAAAQFGTRLGKTADLQFWRGVVAAELPWFASQLRTDPADILGTIGLPNPPRSARTRP